MASLQDRFNKFKSGFIGFLGDTTRNILETPVTPGVSSFMQSKPIQTAGKIASKVTGVGEALFEPAFGDYARNVIGQGAETLAILGMNDQQRAAYKPQYLKDNTQESARAIAGSLPKAIGGTLGLGTGAGVTTLGGMTALDTAFTVPFESTMSAMEGRGLVSGARRGFQDVLGRVGQNVPRAGFYGAVSNPIGAGIASRAGFGKVGQAATTGLTNIAEDYATWKMGMTNRPTAGSNVQAFLTPFITGGVTPRDVKNSFDSLGEGGFIRPGAVVRNGAIDPEAISRMASNSFATDPRDMGDKPDRLSGEGFSLEEARTGLAKNGEYLKNRIIFGKNDSGDIIVKDGRHLLEAYRMLGKEIPIDKIKFEDGVRSNMIGPEMQVDKRGTARVRDNAGNLILAKRSKNAKEYLKNIGARGDLIDYENALNSGNLQEASRIGNLHPGDSRYQVHKTLMNLR